MRWWIAALCLFPVTAEAQPVGPPASWYDPAPLLESLRPSERARVTSDAGLTDASRLPLYDLSIDLADDLATFELEETAWITNTGSRPWSDVVFRVFVNAVTPAGERPLVELVGGDCLDNVSCTMQASSPSAIVVHPSQPLPVDGRVRVRLRLRGRLRPIDPARTTMMGQGMEGLSAISGGHGGGDYGLLATSERVASMAAFFPVLARQRAGRWEESDASTLGDLGTDTLAHVRARVRTADGVRVAATGLEGVPRVVGDRAETELRASFVRDFALVASARLRSIERREGAVTVRSFYIGDTPATDESRAREAAARTVLDAASGSLALFVRRFTDYPYTELDVVEAPLIGGAGGVEFTGMVTVATMFYRPVDAGGGGPLGALLGGGNGANLTARRGPMLEFVTAHEVAHQFWHGIIGSDSRNHPFVDEGLAQYSALLYVEEAHGADRARTEGEQQVAASYHMMRMMGRPDGAVDRSVSTFTDPLSYAGLVYGKGPYLYVALRQRLGDRAFFGALRQHAEAHRFGMAAPRALFDRMARGRHAREVRRLERRWLEETHGDDDLGPPDVGRMLGGQANDPAMRAVLDMLGGQGGQGGQGAPDLGELMRALGGGGGSGGSGGDAPDDAQLQQMMRGLMDMMGGSSP